MTDFKLDNVKIRPVTRLDIDSILALHKKIGIKSSKISHMISQNFGGPMDYSLVAVLDKKIVGFVIARLMYAYIPFVEICLMNGIIVDPQYRRLKIGQKLINEMFNYCRKEKVETVRALVDNDNAELRHFVKGLGFQPSSINNWDKSTD